MTNKEFNENLRKRIMAFVIRVLKFIETVPNNSATRVMNYQLTKSSTSTGANHRAYCRGRSRNERFSKICIVVEEADETLFWLEVYTECKYGDQVMLASILVENTEILKVTASIKDSMYT